MNASIFINENFMKISDYIDVNGWALNAAKVDPLKSTNNGGFVVI